MKNNRASSTDRFEPDLDMLDFASAYAEQPEGALARLELLVRSRPSCLGRIALLRAFAGTTDRPFPPLANPPVPEEFTAEIDLLAEGQLFDAFLDGRLTPDRVARLHRLTCDPDALWAANARTGAGEGDEEAPRATEVTQGPSPS
jgi:hypothetical protein